jgi:hypothetical protein
MLSSTRDATSCAVSQELFSILSNPNVHNLVHKSPVQARCSFTRFVTSPFFTVRGCKPNTPPPELEDHPSAVSDYVFNIFEAVLHSW